MRTNTKKPQMALVLSGGGARGAYEAGVIKYLRQELPIELQEKIHFDILCGASIGAFNCCLLAGYNEAPAAQGEILTRIWQNLQIDHVYQVGWRELINLPKFLFGSKGRGELDTVIGAGRLGGLLNTSPLEVMSKENNVKWENIEINIQNGFLNALAINATHIASGMGHVFIQNQSQQLPIWHSDYRMIPILTKITRHHALASSAIPWIFPAVEIGGEIYSDGALIMNTPISPALKLGADKIFGIALTPQKQRINKERIDTYPSAVFLLGKIFNALLSDKTQYELEKLQRINTLVSMGFSPAQELALKTARGSTYRQIDAFVVRPSRDLVEVADWHLHEGNVVERAGSLVGPFLRRLRSTQTNAANDLMSYLMFDGDYTNDLIKLGMHDTDAFRDKIIEFFKN